MEEWINQLFSYVDPTWGPWVVFGLLLLSGIGIPLGEDIIIIPAGMIVAHGEMPLWPTLLAAYCGVVCGDLLWFMVCTKFGTRIIHKKKWFKRFIHPKRMLQAKYQFDKRGAWVIVLARFIPASRTTTPQYAASNVGHSGISPWATIIPAGMMMISSQGNSYS